MTRYISTAFFPENETLLLGGLNCLLYFSPESTYKIWPRMHRHARQLHTCKCALPHHIGSPPPILRRLAKPATLSMPMMSGLKHGHVVFCIQLNRALIVAMANNDTIYIIYVVASRLIMMGATMSFAGQAPMQKCKQRVYLVYCTVVRGASQTWQKLRDS
eukprot:scaffold154933_cov18-Prasinocladus_malaysianus.AAC.2